MDVARPKREKKLNSQQHGTEKEQKIKKKKTNFNSSGQIFNKVCIGLTAEH